MLELYPILKLIDHLQTEWGSLDLSKEEDKVAFIMPNAEA